MAIKSFADEQTLRFDRGELPSDLPSEVARRLVRVLRMIEAAPDLETLRSIPSMRRATLVDGQCSIPIEGGWRITFRWSDEDAWNVRAEEA
jgi:plasmid maintenance system killer protein